MAEPAAAAADLAADVAAHHDFILAARERHEAVRALAMLSAKAEGAWYARKERMNGKNQRKLYNFMLFFFFFFKASSYIC